jgi:very-short-patch-repair endonuclease
MRRKIIPYNPALKELARQLRNNSTKSEIKLWLQLKGKQMMGYDFHRQKPVDNFILDFFCHELMLGIELDGLTHQSEEAIEKDEIKERRLKELGITILRFNDSEVIQDMTNVLREIEFWILDRTHPDKIFLPKILSPLSRGENTAS